MNNNVNHFFQVGKVYCVAEHKRNPGRLFKTIDSSLKGYERYIDTGTCFTIIDSYSREFTETRLLSSTREISVAKTFVNNEVLYLTYFVDSSIGQLINQGELFSLIC